MTLQTSPKERKDWRFLIYTWEPFLFHSPYWFTFRTFGKLLREISFKNCSNQGLKKMKKKQSNCDGLLFWLENKAERALEPNTTNAPNYYYTSMYTTGSINIKGGECPCVYVLHYYTLLHKHYAEQLSLYFSWLLFIKLSVWFVVW